MTVLPYISRPFLNVWQFLFMKWRRKVTSDWVRFNYWLTIFCSVQLVAVMSCSQFDCSETLNTLLLWKHLCIKCLYRVQSVTSPHYSHNGCWNVTIWQDEAFGTFCTAFCFLTAVGNMGYFLFHSQHTNGQAMGGNARGQKESSFRFP